MIDVPAFMYDRKMDARPFDTINDILRCPSLVQSLLKGRNVPIWRKREPTHMRQAGTERLRLRGPKLCSKLHKVELDFNCSFFAYRPIKACRC